MLTGRTRLVGLVGSPVTDSLSPRMQNAAFAARGLDWAYVPLPVEADGLESALRGLAPLGFAGANVTVPHKTAVLAFCDEIDGFAERAGSANTIVVQDGRLTASSTDGLAVTGAVETAGARALVLGAGGAAQAVATALADAAVSSITVAARHTERGQALAARLRAVFPKLEVEAVETWPPVAGEATLVVNTTPVRDKVLVDLSPGRALVDLPYRPDGSPTALVEAARKAGCRTIVDGLEILVRQGAASFERWTLKTAPVNVMRVALDSNGG